MKQFLTETDSCNSFLGETSFISELQTRFYMLRPTTLPYFIKIGATAAALPSICFSETRDQEGVPAG
jgi:hypothetical protein